MTRRHPCGRIKSADRSYLTTYALLRSAVMPVNVPVVLGIDWHAAFDAPTRIGNAYWIGIESDWREVRGGHAVCLRPPRLSDRWRSFYDQQETPHCVGFAWSRCMSLLNRRAYDGHALFAAADRIDGIAGSNGTTIVAGAQTLNRLGAYPIRAGRTSGPSLPDGIAEYRWTTSATEIARVLGLPTGAESVEVLNSWSGYPTVRMPLAALQRLLDAGGDACIPVDRM